MFFGRTDAKAETPILFGHLMQRVDSLEKALMLGGIGSRRRRGRLRMRWLDGYYYIMSDSLQPHGLQLTRLPCPSLSPGVCSNSRSLSWRCHPTISSPVTPFFSSPQSFSASGSFKISQFFKLASQTTEASASASVLPVNIQGYFL